MCMCMYMAPCHVSLDNDLNKRFTLGYEYIAKRHKASLANGSDGVLTTERQKHRQTMAKPVANDSFLLGISTQHAGANQEKCACGSAKLRHTLRRKLSSVCADFIDIGVRDCIGYYAIAILLCWRTLWGQVCRQTKVPVHRQTVVQMHRQTKQLAKIIEKEA